MVMGRGCTLLVRRVIDPNERGCPWVFSVMSSPLGDVR